MKFQAADIIAVLMILSYVFLKFSGLSDGIDNYIILIIGFYFGKEHEKAINTSA